VLFRSYCIVGEKTLLVAEEKVLRAVLTRGMKMPDFSAAIGAGVKEVDWSATIACLLDIKDIREKRPGRPSLFIPGLDLLKVEERVESLNLAVKCGDEVTVLLTAVCSKPESAAALKGQVEKFTKFAKEALTNDPVKAPQEVVALFNFAPAVDVTRVLTTIRLPAAPLAGLLNILNR